MTEALCKYYKVQNIYKYNSIYQSIYQSRYLIFIQYTMFNMNVVGKLIYFPDPRQRRTQIASHGFISIYCLIYNSLGFKFPSEVQKLRVKVRQCRLNLS